MLKWFWIFLGSTSVLAGLMVIWTPVPLGLPLLMVGFPLLMKYSPQSRDGVQRMAAQFPRLFKPLRRLIPLDKPPTDLPSSSDENTGRND
jgi:hypothetical protein